MGPATMGLKLAPVGMAVALIVFVLSAGGEARGQGEPASGPVPVKSAAGDESGFHLSIFGFAGYPSDSALRVSDEPDPGTRLGLDDDLGIRVAGEVGLWLGYHFDRNDDLAASISHIFLW